MSIPSRKKWTKRIKANKKLYINLNMEKFISFKRIKKPNLDPNKFLRLFRQEFGHKFNKKKISKNDLNKFYYPDSRKIIWEISKFHKVPYSFINIGLGAESLIKDLYLWHSKKFSKKKIVGFGVPNYFMYTIYAKIFNYKILNYTIEPSKILKQTTADVIKFISKNKIKLLIITNPSNPFEKNWSRAEITKIVDYCKKKKIIMLIDEVYQGSGSKSVDYLTKKYSNLIIVRSFSKVFGLPGIRVGYIIASSKICKEIETYRLSTELPQTSIDEALKALEKRQKILKKNSKKIILARNYAHKELYSRGFKTYNYYNNSVTIDLKNKFYAQKVGNYLKKRKIYINYCFPKKLSKYINFTTTHISNIIVDLDS